ncbi:MAG: hypothetical protein H0W50_09420 [Parachlamydiaceae bacterium]|nr:hypothetical protein [Parachlamydiaceae bacterium]
MNLNIELPLGVKSLGYNYPYFENYDPIEIEAIRQDEKLAELLRKFTSKECYNFEDLTKYCVKNNIDFKNCSLQSLGGAIWLNDNFLADQINKSEGFRIERSSFGYNSLLYILPLGIKAHLSVIKLISAGANINCALGGNNTLSYFKGLSTREIPIHATPLYMAIESSKYFPTVCFLEKNGAICHPQASEEGQNLINKARWLNNAGFQFYMGALFCQDFVLKKLGVPLDVTNCIIRTCVKI